MIRFCLRPLLAFVGVLAVMALMASEVDARPGGGKSFGSRGSRTFSAPAPTRTAPSTARPMERTTAQPARPAAAAAPAGASARPGLFNRPGLLGGLAAGFLGAGLLGMLFGQGLFSNLAGFASILGFIAQLGLVVALGWLAWSWWQRRSQPQAAFAGHAPSAGPAPSPMMPGQAGLAGSQPQHGVLSSPPPEPSDEIGITASDYDAFERLLIDVQSAYAAEDMSVLGERATPEMLSYMSEELQENAKHGVVAVLSGTKLLQGDLSEAWREGNTDYATVAMRYEIVDQRVDRRTRQLVEGEAGPVEVTELWTFTRPRGGKWLLSAIQQTDET